VRSAEGASTETPQHATARLREAQKRGGSPKKSTKKKNFATAA
jgi:hypothetical protein